MLSLLAGNTTTLPIAQLASLLGISPVPLPNPLVDPFGFITNPLVVPIILNALTGDLI
jgi:hypothetical protein